MWREIRCILYVEDVKISFKKIKNLIRYVTEKKYVSLNTYLYKYYEKYIARFAAKKNIIIDILYYGFISYYWGNQITIKRYPMNENKKWKNRKHIAFKVCMWYI